MSLDELSELENKVYEYAKKNDFETKPWSTRDAARAIGSTEKEVYEAMSELSRKAKNNFWIFYKDGSLRVAAD